MFDVSKMKLITVAGLLLSVLINVTLQNSPEKAHLFTAPSVLDSGTSESFCLTLFGVVGNGQLIMEIEASGNSQNGVEYFRNTKSKCFKFKVPEILDATANLKIYGYFGEYNFREITTVNIRQVSDLILIHTDKAVYKVTQTVRFRILHLTPEFFRSNNRIRSVLIEDPFKTKVYEKNDPDSQEGIYDLSFDISERPRLGNWTIVAVDNNNNRREKAFSVQEYELPSFVVRLTPPNVISSKFKKLTYKVCAEYTYDEKTRGKLKTNVTFESNNPAIGKAMVPRELSIDGCMSIQIDKDEFELNGGDLWNYDTATFYAAVTEDETGRSMSSVVKKDLKLPHLFRFLSKPYYKPGLPYNGKIYLHDQYGNPLPNEQFVIEYRLEKVNVKTDAEGLATFTISTRRDDDQFLSLKVTAKDFKKYIYHYFGFGKAKAVAMKRFRVEDLKPWYSFCKCFINVKGPLQMPMKCNFKTQLTIEMTSDCVKVLPENFDVYYQILAKNNLENQFQETIPKNGLVRTAGNTRTFILPISIASKMSPKIEVLVYLVTNRNEIVSDSETFPVEKCFENKVETKFNAQKISPGAKATLKIQTASDSMCSVYVTDKSVQLLSGSEFNPYSVINMINNIPPNTNDLNKDKKCNEYDPKYGYYERNPGILASRASFDSAGLIAMTNLPLSLNHCTPRDKITNAKPYFGDYDGNGGDEEEIVVVDKQIKYGPEVDVRHFFPDTWIWELVPMNGQNSVSLQRTIPHSVTKWTGNAFCISPSKGLGISSSPASIISYLHAALSISMPDTIVQGEAAPITVDIKSYFPDCFPATIVLENNHQYELLSKSIQVQKCICGKQANIFKYHINATTPGTINVTVNFHAIPAGHTHICLDETNYVWAFDNVRISRIIQVPAIPRETSHSKWICASGNKKTEKMALTIPADAVPGTPKRARALVTGDVMAPAISNMNHLITLPTRCSEQTMMAFAPLVFIVSYLQTTKQLTNELRNTATRYISAGYANQLKYQLGDGSYNTWGERNKRGSIWLTAFVTKSFAFARSKLSNLVAIDQNVIQRGFNYLASHQRQDGCFYLHHEHKDIYRHTLKGAVGAGDDSDAAVTLYVLIALLESSQTSANVINNAFRCINKDTYPTTFRQSMKAYALALAGKTAEANALVTTMQLSSTTIGDTTFWSAGTTRAINIETASYFLLAIATLRPSHIDLGMRIVRWLVNQRNAHGGYVSTQDTVMAIQAMEEFISHIGTKSADMTVKIKTGAHEAIANVHGNNRLATIKIPIKGNEIEVETSGNGCVLVQFTISYYTGSKHIAKTFYLDVTVKKSPDSTDQIVKKTLHICTRYQDKHAEESNMVIIEVQLPTGYIADDQSAKLIPLNINFGKWEHQIGKEILYFNALTKSLTCFDIEITERMRMSDRKPAIMKVYDYYAPEFESSTEYSV